MVTLSNRVGTVGATPTSTNLPTAKTIGQLNRLTPELRLKLRQFLLPTEYQDEQTLALANFGISVGDLLDALTLKDLGLDKVNNTSDEDKPLSRLMIEALAAKKDATASTTVDDIQGLQEKLNDYRLKNVSLKIGEIEQLAEILANKSDKEHKHEIDDVNGLRILLDGFANINHSHSLSSLSGWSEFTASLNVALASFVTVDQVNNLIDQRALVMKTWEWDA